MNTTASAQGNAAALVNVIESSPPETCPFEKVLTPEMELLHFINNDDVLEHAEEIDTLLTQNATTLRRYTAASDKQRARHGLSLRTIDRRNERIAELEAEILAEIDEAQNEYRMLAEALCEKRESYISAREIIGNAPITEAQRKRLARHGNIYERPELTRTTAGPVIEFERIHGSYKLLESGFAHVTTAEQLGRILSAIGREILMEVVTLGLAKYVRAARLAASALDNAASALGAAGKAIVVARYQRLSPAARERLTNLYRRRQPDAEFEAPRDGSTGTGPGTRATTRNCATGACR